ncbi:hypothetical protein FB567DRAFT_457257 [Paraphoma chrysanthemicola]|uniref:NAD(P)-binding protein n=1 Tax=Paraphoma chrysanthemicola TaxID=798071 RepID=A0A8K0VRH2_9PLEO|nr:hypothetical protein FB567DRAFT_457257 [Paraphoma chrysanthemicola]
MPFHHITKTVHHAAYPAIDVLNPSNSARGKTVVVSGGAGGIGYAITRGFALAGADVVVILSRRQEALDKSSKKLRAELDAAKSATKIWTYILEMTDLKGARPVFDNIRERLNEGASAENARDIDVLVTNAASLYQGKSTLDLGIKAFQESFQTNLIGNLSLVEAFLAPEIPAIPFTGIDGISKDTTKAQTPRHEKIILDVSSGSVHTVHPGQAAYGPSKLAFTRTLNYLQREVDALEGAPIRIHSFHPGVLWTPGVAALFGDEKIEAYEYDEEGLPGSFAVWLASPAAAFTKGRLLWSNWDVEELVAMKAKFEEDPEFCTLTLQI